MTIQLKLKTVPAYVILLLSAACSSLDLNKKLNGENSEIEIQANWRWAFYSTPNSLEDNLTSSNSKFFIVEDLDSKKSDLGLIQLLKTLFTLLIMNVVALGITTFPKKYYKAIIRILTRFEQKKTKHFKL